MSEARHMVPVIQSYNTSRPGSTFENRDVTFDNYTDTGANWSLLGFRMTFIGYRSDPPSQLSY
jgi:hypothetical protein